MAWVFYDLPIEDDLRLFPDLLCEGIGPPRMLPSTAYAGWYFSFDQLGLLGLLPISFHGILEGPISPLLGVSIS